jgi:hypothetical protein
VGQGCYVIYRLVDWNVASQIHGKEAVEPGPSQ